MASITLHDISPRFMADLRAWAKLRRKSEEAAAKELIRIGLEITSEKVQQEAREAIATLSRIKAGHVERN